VVVGVVEHCLEPARQPHSDDAADDGSAHTIYVTHTSLTIIRKQARTYTHLGQVVVGVVEHRLQPARQPHSDGATDDGSAHTIYVTHTSLTIILKQARTYTHLGQVVVGVVEHRLQPARQPHSDSATDDGSAQILAIHPLRAERDVGGCVL